MEFDALQNPMPPAGKQLTLYLPCFGREITLKRNRITVGRDRFRDLDLSQLPEAEFLEKMEGEFYYGNGAWYFSPANTPVTARLNDRPLSVQHERLSRGDCLVLSGRAVLIIRDFPQDEAAQDELKNNIQMFFESIHLKNGHLGCEVRYDAARRVVVSRQWGIVGGKTQDPTPAELAIPAHITTREELYRYVGEQKPGWRLDYRGTSAYREDVLLWLGRDEDLQYVASRRQLRHRYWLQAPGGTKNGEQWFELPDCPNTEEAVRENVRRQYPRFPHNRKSELDADMELSVFSDPCRLNYYAQSREVVCRKGMEPAVERIAIPEGIDSRNELQWYLMIHRRAWMGRILHEERMLRDTVLSTRGTVAGGKIIHEEVRYRAEDRTVSLLKWDDGPGGDEYTLEVPLQIPYHIFGFDQMIQFVRKNRPAWLGRMPDWKIPRP